MCVLGHEAVVKAGPVSYYPFFSPAHCICPGSSSRGSRILFGKRGLSPYRLKRNLSPYRLKREAATVP